MARFRFFVANTEKEKYSVLSQSLIFLRTHTREEEWCCPSSFYTMI